MTNWEMIKAAIDDEIDDGGASRESCIYYDIACPYRGNDPEAVCYSVEGMPTRDMCVECKEKWLEKEYE